MEWPSCLHRRSTSAINLILVRLSRYYHAHLKGSRLKLILLVHAWFLQLDMYMADSIKMMYKSIRHRALIQYTTPFTSVQLGTMAAAFNTTVSGLEEELSTLIIENQIQVCICSKYYYTLVLRPW